jgi:hypothetical protein
VAGSASVGSGDAATGVFTASTVSSGFVGSIIKVGSTGAGVVVGFDVHLANTIITRTDTKSAG